MFEEHFGRIKNELGPEYTVEGHIGKTESFPFETCYIFIVHKGMNAVEVAYLPNAPKGLDIVARTISRIKHAFV